MQAKAQPKRSLEPGSVHRLRAIGDGVLWLTPCKRRRSRSAAWSPARYTACEPSEMAYCGSPCKRRRSRSAAWSQRTGLHEPWRGSVVAPPPGYSKSSKLRMLTTIHNFLLPLWLKANGLCHQACFFSPKPTFFLRFMQQKPTKGMKANVFKPKEILLILHYYVQ